MNEEYTTVGLTGDELLETALRFGEDPPEGQLLETKSDRTAADFIYEVLVVALLASVVVLLIIIAGAVGDVANNVDTLVQGGAS